MEWGRGNKQIFGYMKEREMHDDTSVVVLAWVSRPLLRGLGLVSSWTLFGLEEGSTRRPGPGAASLLLPSTVLLPVEPITCIYVKKKLQRVFCSLLLCASSLHELRHLTHTSQYDGLWYSSGVLLILTLFSLILTWSQSWLGDLYLNWKKKILAFCFLCAANWKYAFHI